MYVGWSFRSIETSHCLVKEARFFLGLSLSFLHVLFLEIGMLLIHAILAELKAHISHPNINICVELLWLDQAFQQLSLLLLRALIHNRRVTRHLRVESDPWAQYHALIFHFLRHISWMDAHHLRTPDISEETIIIRVNHG